VEALAHLGRQAAQHGQHLRRLDPALGDGQAVGDSPAIRAAKWASVASISMGKEYLGDKGFGAAALSMAPLFRYQPALRDGKPVAMSIPVKVEFACDSRCRAFRGASVREDRRWLAVPTPDQVLAAYPPVARGRGVEGQVRLDCGVGKAGGLEACETIAESVEGEGFAAAALGLTSLFRLEAPEPKASPVRIGLVVAFGPSPAIPAWFQGRRYVPLLDRRSAPRMKSWGGSASAMIESRMARGSPNRWPWP
jgi:TonB family protein